MSVKNVDDYIKICPPETEIKLTKLREIIKKTAPNSEEKISYSMPFYEYKGRLVYFALNKNYIGLYIPPPIIEDHKKELESYVTTKSAIHFPLDKRLPTTLIKKLVKARLLWNESLEKKKNN